MKLDPKALARLLALDDTQLQESLKKIAADSGLDLSSLSLRPEDIASLRRALSGVTEEDVVRAGKQLSAYRKQQGGKS